MVMCDLLSDHIYTGCPKQNGQIHQVITYKSTLIHHIDLYVIRPDSVSASFTVHFAYHFTSICIVPEMKRHLYLPPWSVIVLLLSLSFLALGFFFIHFCNTNVDFIFEFSQRIVQKPEQSLEWRDVCSFSGRDKYLAFSSLLLNILICLQCNIMTCFFHHVDYKFSHSEVLDLWFRAVCWREIVFGFSHVWRMTGLFITMRNSLRNIMSRLYSIHDSLQNHRQY